MSPVYAQSTFPLQMTCLNPGDKQTVWSAENPATGKSSQAVAISPPRFGENTRYISAEFQFSGAPGSFDYRIQVADTDVDGAYQDVPNLTLTAVNGSNWGRLEAIVTAKYARLNAHTQNANAVNVTASINR